MEHEKLSRFLGALSTLKVAPTAGCPDEHELAAFVDGGLPGESSKKMTTHLADCEYCVAQVGLLTRLGHTAPGQAASELALARARRLGKNSKRTALQRVSRWACAAVIVLALSLLIKTTSSDPEVSQAIKKALPDAVSETIGPRQSRNLNTDALRPKVLAPVNGAIVDPGSLVFTWTGVPGSLHYDVRVVTEDGDLVWQTRVAGTELRLPATLHLEPDEEYFFRVDAYLANAKSLNSRHVLFTVGGQR
ncbi:MAG: fibronectin type III domain-containing protein [Xanthomonadales bacterium]|nr:fibronectin type III domain-containing protein [Xanthomonadales bacterium]